MLEQSIDQLTQAVRELVTTLQVGRQIEKIEPSVPAAKAEAPKVEAEAPAMQVEIRTLTAADVRAAVVACSRTHGNDVARGILNAAGVAKLPDLPESKYMEVYQACKRLGP